MTDLNTFPYPILITGGAGFLGSHMAALCLEKHTDVVVIDNLSNSDLSNLQKLESYFQVTIPFYEIDIRDQNKLKQFFKDHQFSAVIHFAGSDYQLEKSFLKNYQGIFIFKKLAYVQ